MRNKGYVSAILLFGNINKLPFALMCFSIGTLAFATVKITLQFFSILRKKSALTSKANDSLT